MVKPLILYSGVRADALINALFTYRVDSAIKDYEFNTSNHIASPLSYGKDCIVYMVSHSQVISDVKGILAELYRNYIGVREWFPPLVFLVYDSPKQHTEEFSSGENYTLPTEELLPIKVVYITASTDRHMVLTSLLEPNLEIVIQRHLRLRYLAFKTSTFSPSQPQPSIQITPSSLKNHKLDNIEASIVIYDGDKYGMLVLSDQGVDEAVATVAASKNPDTHVPIVGTIVCDTKNEITTGYGPFSKNRISEHSYDDTLRNDDELIENMQALVSLYSYTVTASSQKGSFETKAYSSSTAVGVTDLNSFLHSLFACDEWFKFQSSSTTTYNTSLYGLLQTNSSNVELMGLAPQSVIISSVNVFNETRDALIKIKRELKRKDEQAAVDTSIELANTNTATGNEFIRKIKSVYDQVGSLTSHDPHNFDATMCFVSGDVNPAPLYDASKVSASIHSFINVVDFTKSLDDSIRQRPRLMTAYNKTKQAFLRLCYIEYIGRYCYVNSASSQATKETPSSISITLNKILEYWNTKGDSKNIASSSSSAAMNGSRIPDRLKIDIGHHLIPVHLIDVEHLQNVNRHIVREIDMTSSSSSSTAGKAVLEKHRGFHIEKALDSINVGSDEDLANTLVTWYTAKLLLHSEYAKRKMPPSKRIELQAKFDHMQHALGESVHLRQTI
jgi:hypothetical protein